MTSTESSPNAGPDAGPEIPENFMSVVGDFVSDLSTTFPEYAFLWAKWSVAANCDDREIEDLFGYMTKVYPERFFDILYQNEDMFKTDNESNTRFLPNVDFKLLYNCPGISETTRNAIWKYLQLILMTILKSVKNKMNFGETANIFDEVNEGDLQEKLRETMEGIGEFFKGISSSDSASDSANGAAGAGTWPDNLGESFGSNPTGSLPGSNPNLFDSFSGTNFNGSQSGAQSGSQSSAQSGSQSGTQMPDASDLHEHLKGLFDGKIGALAKELAEDIAADAEKMFGDEFGEKAEIKTTEDLLKKMMRNPKKMMDLMKTIGGKITQKMKSGEISEEEIMKEAGELMSKMKGMGDKGQFADILKNMAKGFGAAGGGGGGIPKFNAQSGAAAFANMEKQMATKERMQQKLAAKKLDATADPTKKVFRMDDGGEQGHTKLPAFNDAELEKMFSQPEAKAGDKKKKSKGKGKK